MGLPCCLFGSQRLCQPVPVSKNGDITSQNSDFQKRPKWWFYHQEIKKIDFTSEWWIRVDPELGDDIGWAAILWGLNLRERDDR